PFEWVPVLNLCQWAVAQPREPGDGDGPWGRDHGWQWTRTAIVDLLEQGFRPGPCEIQFPLRDAVWRVLHPITDDPDPPPSDPAEPPDPEPLAKAINTTRGRAMEVVVRYAVWAKAQLSRGGGAASEGEIGLQQMPEVGDVLAAHLDAARDPAPALRS